MPPKANTLFEKEHAVGVQRGPALLLVVAAEALFLFAVGHELVHPLALHRFQINGGLCFLITQKINFALFYLHTQ